MTAAFCFAALILIFRKPQPAAKTTASMRPRLIVIVSSASALGSVESKSSAVLMSYCRTLKALALHALDEAEARVHGAVYHRGVKGVLRRDDEVEQEAG